MENGDSLYALIAKLDARIVELEAQNKRLLWKMLMIKDIATHPELPKLPEAKPKTLENLSCEDLQKRLRVLGEPVSGLKADLIKRIRKHEELKEALFKED